MYASVNVQWLVKQAVVKVYMLGQPVPVHVLTTAVWKPLLQGV